MLTKGSESILSILAKFYGEGFGLEKSEISIDDPHTIGIQMYDENGIVTSEKISFNKFRKLTGVKVTDKMTGKMKGLGSFNTSCVFNKFCRARAKNPNMICSKCYAIGHQKMYFVCAKCWHKNGMVLKNKIIPFGDLPTIDAKKYKYFRFEAFGDLEDEIQLFNYFRTCIKNPKIKFALWTKNPWIVQSVIDQGYPKPFNLNIILSSPYTNVEANYENYDWADGTFTVYCPTYIDENKIDINCGARSCLKCGKCYEKHKEFIHVREKLK